MTRESLAREVEANPVAQKYARRIGLLESARKAVGAKPMSTFEKYYAGQLFENIQKGNLYEEKNVGYCRTQKSCQRLL